MFKRNPVTTHQPGPMVFLPELPQPLFDSKLTKDILVFEWHRHGYQLLTNPLAYLQCPGTVWAFYLECHFELGFKSTHPLLQETLLLPLLEHTPVYPGLIVLYHHSLSWQLDDWATRPPSPRALPMHCLVSACFTSAGQGPTHRQSGTALPSS